MDRSIGLPSSRRVAGLKAAKVASCASVGARIALRVESPEAARHMGCKACIDSSQCSCGPRRHVPADRRSMRFLACLPRRFSLLRTPRSVP